MRGTTAIVSGILSEDKRADVRTIQFGRKATFSSNLLYIAAMKVFLGNHKFTVPGKIDSLQ